MKKLLLILVPLMLVVTLAILPSQATIEFTTEELEWIENHQVIRYAPDINFGPIEYMDGDGVIKGATLDYLDWISEHTNLEFEIVAYQNWSEIIEAAKGKKIDMIAAARTEQREAYLTFTQPFISVPNVIITRSDWDKEVSLEDLDGKEVLVLKDYAIEDYIESQYPKIKLLPVVTLDEGISRVSLGTDDYMAVSLAQASFFMKEKTITNLKVGGDTNYDNDLSFAIRNDWMVLEGIMDKALKAMPEEERSRIYSRWVHIETEPFVSREIIIGIMVSLIVSLIIILSITWFNTTLRKRVAEKTDELEKLNNCLEEKVEQRTAALVEAEKMASLGRMVVGLSHQLNTPLGSSIAGVSLVQMRQTAVRDLIEGGNLSKGEFVKFIVENEKTMKLVDQELHKAKEIIEHFGSMTSTLSEQDRSNMNISNYLKHLLKTYKASLQNKNIEVVVNCDADLQILIARVFLDNIFNNLISNSIKHGFKNRDKGLISIGVFYEDERINIEYKDNGEGIDKRFLSNIYEPLFTTSMGQTTGMGLNILYNTVVISLKGEIELISDLGQGVHFKISIGMQN